MAEHRNSQIHAHIATERDCEECPEFGRLASRG